MPQILKGKTDVWFVFDLFSIILADYFNCFLFMPYQFRNALFLFCFLLSVLATSCEKDIAAKVLGTYKGTVRFKQYRYPDGVTPIKDTLFMDVLITVSQSESSKRKASKINLSFNTNQFHVTPTSDIPIIDGYVKHYTSEKGAAISNNWDGSIKEDSLKLIYKSADHIKYVQEYIFEAKKW